MTDNRASNMEVETSKTKKHTKKTAIPNIEEKHFEQKEKSIKKKKQHSSKDKKSSKSKSKKEKTAAEPVVEKKNEKKRKAVDDGDKDPNSVTRVAADLNKLSIPFDVVKLAKVKRRHEKRYEELTEVMRSDSGTAKGLIFAYSVKTPVGRIFWYSPETRKFKPVRLENSLIKLTKYPKEALLNIADIQKSLSEKERKAALDCINATESDIVKPETWLFALVETGIVEKDSDIPPLSTQASEAVLVHDIEKKQTYWMNSDMGKARFSLAVVTRTRTITENNLNNEIIAFSNKRKAICRLLEDLGCLTGTPVKMNDGTIKIRTSALATSKPDKKQKKSKKSKKISEEEDEDEDVDVLTAEAEISEPEKKKKKTPPQSQAEQKKKKRPTAKKVKLVVEDEAEVEESSEVENPKTKKRKIEPAIPQQSTVTLSGVKELMETDLELSSASSSSTTTSTSKSDSDSESESLDDRKRRVMPEKEKIIPPYKSSTNPNATSVAASLKFKHNIDEALRCKKILDGVADREIRDFRDTCG